MQLSPLGFAACQSKNCTNRAITTYFHNEMDRNNLSRLHVGRGSFIDRLFGHGLDLLHLRKPSSTIEACRELLRQIPERWHSRIVLHDHFPLTGEFHLHGVHLNRRCPHAPDGYMGSISCSCHSLEEVAKKKPTSDYVFLSPIFNSISKAGYEAAFSTAALQYAAEEGIMTPRFMRLAACLKSI